MHCRLYWKSRVFPHSEARSNIDIYARAWGWIIRRKYVKIFTLLCYYPLCCNWWAAGADASQPIHGTLWWSQCSEDVTRMLKTPELQYVSYKGGAVRLISRSISNRLTALSMRSLKSATQRDQRHGSAWNWGVSRNVRRTKPSPSESTTPTLKGRYPRAVSVTQGPRSMVLGP